MRNRFDEEIEGKSGGFKLNITDLRILEAIHDLQDQRVSSIAEKIGLSKVTVKRRLRNLRKLGLFAKEYVVNFWRMNLIPLMIIGQDLLGNVDQKFLRYYCRFIRSVMGSVPYDFLDLIVPAKRLSNILEHFYGSFKNVEAYFIKSFHESVSFRFYDMAKNAWKIDYFALALYIREIMVKEGYIDILKQISPIKTIAEKSPSRPIKLNNRRIETILSFKAFSDKRSSPLTLGVGGSKYAFYRIKSELINLNSLRTFINVYPPKLVEKLFLIIEKCDEHFLEALLLGLSELPSLIFYKANKMGISCEFIKENVTIVRLELPEGGFTGFLENFTEMLIEEADFKLYLETEALTPSVNGGRIAR